MIAGLKRLTQAWPIAKVLFGIAGALVIAVLAAHGAYEFIREAPALIDAQARHLQMHHDSIANAYSAIESQAAIAKHIEGHLETEDSANRKRDDQLTELARQTRYLVCLRLERERELNGLPPMRDCSAQLLEVNR